ncbi:MAG: hypothetical protein ABI298_07460 [Acidimicrobiales bacterium]
MPDRPAIMVPKPATTFSLSAGRSRRRAQLGDLLDACGPWNEYAARDHDSFHDDSKVLAVAVKKFQLRVE